MKKIFAILDKLSLSNHDRESVKQFKANQTYPLAVVAILKNYGFKLEATELLCLSFKKNKSLDSIRIAYAKNLFEQGLVLDAYLVINEKVDIVEKSVQAAQLYLKICILLGKDAEVIKILEQLDLSRNHNKLTHELARIINKKGISQASDYLTSELNICNIFPIIPADFITKSEQNTNKAKFFSLLDDLDAKLKRSQFKIQSLDSALASYYKPKSEILGQDTVKDLYTRASIYEKQKNYAKALQIYRTILSNDSENERVRSKIIYLAECQKDQKNNDLTIDPLIVNNMDQIEEKTQKIDFLESLLKKTNRPPRQSLK